MFDKLRNNSKIVIYFVVAAFVITGGMMGFGSYMNRGQSSSSGSNSPNIAKVNDENISRQEYINVLRSQASQASQLSNSQIIPFRLNVLNSMIERRLLLQKAEEMGIRAEVTEKEIDETIDKILKQNELTEEELEKRLSEQGSSMEKFRNNIRESMKTNDKIQKTVEKTYDKVEITEEEVKKKFEESDQYKDKEFADVKENIRKSLLQQRQNEAYNNWLENIKSEAKISINDPILGGYQALKNENYEVAINEFENIIENNTSPSLYTYLANAYQGKGDTEKARSTFKKAVEEYPDNWNLHFSYGDFYRKIEEKEKAIAQYEKASEVAGSDFMAHYRIYMAFNALEAKDKAEAEMAKLKKIQEDMQKTQQEQKVREKIKETTDEINSQQGDRNVSDEETGNNSDQ